MSASEDAIRRVVDAFERSNWAEIDVRSGSVRVHLATSAPDHPSPSRAMTGDTSTAREAPDEAADGATESGAPVTSVADVPPGAVVVVSPSPGIFWRSPEPGLPPFVDIGDAVESSDTVCIIEVMKLMNHVKAGARGEVVAVYGTNGVAVRKDQPLFAIAPAGSP